VSGGRKYEVDFQEFPKIARLKREVIVTEKIDGANVAIVVTDDGDVLCQSRTKFITPQDDYKGFANWVEKNKKELVAQLGYGIHYGEWWGAGLGRGYGLNEKRFSLFNTHQWHTDTEDCRCIEAPLCFVVPVLARIDKFSTEAVDEVMENLRKSGSIAAPGFMDPEGIVVFHSQNQAMFKVTFEYDDTGKGQ
jgi:hypothetical protein